MQHYAYGHAQLRAKERYAADLLPEEVERMAVAIENGHATFVRNAWGGRSIYLVHCPKADRYIPVVYDPAGVVSKIVTVLPEESRQFGLKPAPRPRGPRFREIDPEDLTDETAPEPDPAALAACCERQPNNVLADALRTALEKAGWPLPFAPSSPSAG